MLSSEYGGWARKRRKRLFLKYRTEKIENEPFVNEVTEGEALHCNGRYSCIIRNDQGGI